MLGIDLVYIPEFREQLEVGGMPFIRKAFNSDELAKDTTEHLAGVWAAKEAVVKASGQTVKHWTEIHILYNSNGQPHAMLGTVAYDVSIAHHGDYAVAVAQKA